MAKSKEELNALKEEYKALRNSLLELSDEELSTVAGGRFHEDVYTKTKEEAKYIFNIGDIVEVSNWFWIGTVRCCITDRRIVWYETHNTGGPGIYAVNVAGYRDEYYCKEIEEHWYFSNGWKPRSEIEM